MINNIKKDLTMDFINGNQTNNVMVRESYFYCFVLKDMAEKNYFEDLRGR